MYIPVNPSNVHKIDAATGKRIWVFEPEQDPAIVSRSLFAHTRGIAIGDGRVYVGTADGRLIALQRATRVNVFRAEDMSAEPVEIRNDSRREFTGVAFHPSGQYLAVTSNDATVKFYDTTTWRLAQAFDWDIGRLRSVAFSPDGMLAAAGGDRGKVVVWDVDL